jgi:hypothetical protein
MPSCTLDLKLKKGVWAVVAALQALFVSHRSTALPCPGLERNILAITATNLVGEEIAFVLCHDGRIAVAFG